MSIDETIGRVLGISLAPLAFLASAIRGERIFHPDGVIYRGDVKAAAQDARLEPLAQRLVGTALVRLTGALWSWPQGRRRPDILGIAVRVRGKKDYTPKLLPGDQDLLFATASSLLGMPVSAFATDTGDYLDNTYHSILPFALADFGRVYLRLVPVTPAPPGPDRRQRLAHAVEKGKAQLRLELQAIDLGDAWLPLATIELRERMLLDDAELAFHPGTSAMGLVPEGLLQAVRPPVYAASEAGWRWTRR